MSGVIRHNGTTRFINSHAPVVTQAPAQRRADMKHAAENIGSVVQYILIISHCTAETLYIQVVL